MVAASEDGFMSLGTAAETPDLSMSTTLAAGPMSVLTAKLRKILQSESAASSSTSLASVLVHECTDHVFKTTKIGDSDDCKVFESLHPYWGRGLRDNYSGSRGVSFEETVHFPGAKALRIRFDPKWLG